MQEEAELIEVLRRENPTFSELELAHRRLDERLQVLAKQYYLTEEDEMEKKRLQKEKLMKKDQMAMIILAYKKQLYQPAPQAPPPRQVSPA